MNKKWKVAFSLLEMMESLGYDAFIVGGGVRDYVLGVESKDLDITTNMPITEIEKYWKTHDIGKSKDFGIVVVEKEGFQFEVASFRKESYIRPKYVRKILK